MIHGCVAPGGGAIPAFGPRQDRQRRHPAAQRTIYGSQARICCRALLATALRRIAAEPQGRSTTERSDLAAGLRSVHIRYGRAESRAAAVGDPVHVIFYRAPGLGLVEIVRVLHERMDAGRHLGGEGK